MKHKKSITERIDGAIDYIDRFNVYLNSSDHLLSVIMKKHNNTLSESLIEMKHDILHANDSSRNICDLFVLFYVVRSLLCIFHGDMRTSSKFTVFAIIIFAIEASIK